MKFRNPPIPLLLAVLGLALPVSSALAGNPLNSIGNGLKKVGSALNPFKKAAEPPKALPAAKPTPKAGPKATSQPKTVKYTPPVKKKKAPGHSDDSTPTRKKTGPAKPETTPTPAKVTPLDPAAPPGTPPEPTGSAPPDPAATETSPADGVKKELPFATPVMGQKGYVHSPYAKDEGMVDVSGIPAGTKVKCPFSGKIFRVP